MSTAVQDFCKAVDDEQKQRGIITDQPVVMEYDQVRHISMMLRRKVQTAQGRQRWILAMLRVVFLAGWNTWQRIGNMLQLLQNQCLQMANPPMLIFGYTWGKTLTSGEQHMVGVKPHSDKDMCMFIAMQDFKLAQSRLTSTKSGYMFRKEPNQPAEHMDYKTLQYAFERLLDELGIANGQTLGGLRSSGSVHGCIQGATLVEAMQTGDWNVPKQAAHYMHLQQLLGTQKVPNMMTTPSQTKSHVASLKQAIVYFE